MLGLFSHHNRRMKFRADKTDSCYNGMSKNTLYNRSFMQSMVYIVIT